MTEGAETGRSGARRSVAPDSESRRRLLIGGLPSLGPLNDLALALLRIYVGLAIAIDWGWLNVRAISPPEVLVENVTALGLPAPGLVAFIVAWVEFIGGLLLAVGVLTRLSAAALSAGLFVVAFFYANSVPFVELDVSQSLFWVALFFAFAGAGRLSVDAALRRRATPGNGRSR